jgi:outer membrane protein assembly factor BamE
MAQLRTKTSNNHNMGKLLVLIAALATAGCSDSLRVPLVYRVDINQGNLFDQEMVDQLKPGMTKRQVAFILGTPLVQDAFHSNRWDYVYSNEPGDEDRVEKKFSVFFQKDELVGLEGDLRPSNNPPVDTKKDVTVNIPKIQRDKTVWESITGIFDD